MKAMSPSAFTFLPRPATKLLLGFLLAVGTAALVHAQGQLASGTIGGSGSGPYVYGLTFSDAAGATSPIGSVWYAWVPGSFICRAFLPSLRHPPAGRQASREIPFNLWRTRLRMTSCQANRCQGSAIKRCSRRRRWPPAL